MIDFNLLKHFLFLRYLEDLGYTTSDLCKMPMSEFDELYLRFVRAHTKNFNGSD